MTEFAKLYNTKDYGQILVKHDVDEDDNTEVRLYFVPEGLGVCSIAVTFKNETKDNSQVLFDAMTEDMAMRCVKDVMVEFEEMLA